MKVREASEADIPSIVNLLKLSLGESLMPKSEAFWRWKHVENPFGKSPVLLAFEGTQLIGVRAFMRWEWKHGDKIFKAVRAVDTATHPEHQGKGIFKKLTIQLLEGCKAEGIDFVFNTPNASSKPGYLKMGWEEVGKVPLKLKLHVGLAPYKESYETNDWQVLEDMVFMESLIRSRAADKLQTQVSNAYLSWRYKGNPNLDYHIIYEKGARPFVVIYRWKTHPWIRELRVCELICDEKNAAYALGRLQKRVGGTYVMSISGCGEEPGWTHLFVGVKLGPMLTVRRPDLSARNELFNFTHWSPALGDLEVF